MDVQGDPTEAAFLVAERKLGYHRSAKPLPAVGEVPFTSERKLMSTLQADVRGEGPWIVVVTKGRPTCCWPAARRSASPASQATRDERRGRILATVDRLADLALRTLAVAYRPLPDVPTAEEDESIEPATGLPRHGRHHRPAAPGGPGGDRRGPRREGRDPDDHRRPPRTAIGSPATSGSSRPRRAVTGAELEALDDEAPRRSCEVSVYARVAPEHKLRIVDALQADGRSSP